MLGEVLADVVSILNPTTIVVGRDGTVKKAFVGFGGEKSAKDIHDAVVAALNETAPDA